MNSNEKLSIQILPSASGVRILVSGSRLLDLSGVCSLFKAYIRMMLAEERFSGMDILPRKDAWDPCVTEGLNGLFSFEANPKSDWPFDTFKDVVDRAAKKIVGNVEGAVILPIAA